jgi:hypothetical protein
MRPLARSLPFLLALGLVLPACGEAAGLPVEALAPTTASSPAAVAPEAASLPQVPKLSGMTLRQVERIADAHGWVIALKRKVSKKPKGTVIFQRPLAGTPLGAGRTLLIFLAKAKPPPTIAAGPAPDDGPSPFGPPPTGSGGRHQIGHEDAQGDYATAVASGEADHPSTIWVRVEASPNQTATVYWTMVCSEGYGSGSKDGEFSGTTAIDRALEFPMPNPDTCYVSASAQIDGSGTLDVYLYASP